MANEILGLTNATTRIGIPNADARYIMSSPSISGTNIIQSTSTSIIPLVIKGISGQSANLERWLDNNNNVLASVDNRGILQAVTRSFVTSISGSTTLTQTATVVEQSGIGTVTTLWASPIVGDNVNIKNISAGIITINGNGKNIEVSSTMTLVAGDSATLTYDNTRWIVSAKGSTATVLEQWVSPPISGGAAGVKGQLAWNGTYKYECVDTNTWIRYAVERSW